MTTHLFYTGIIFLCLLLPTTSLKEDSSLSEGLIAGPVYHVMIKFPYCSMVGFMREAYDTTSQSGDSIIFSGASAKSLSGTGILYYAHFYYEESSARLFVAIQSSVEDRWLMHFGKSTRPHSSVQLQKDSSVIRTSADRRLFHCSNPEFCNHDGVVAAVPDTPLYLNGQVPKRGLIFHEKMNYLMFIPSSRLPAATAPGTDLRLGEKLALKTKYSL